MENYSNKIANVFATKYSLKKGDVVALFMENKPEFIGIWLGLSKLGVISALLNTNLRRAPLIHCIKVADPKIVIYGDELETEILDSKENILAEIGVKFVRQGNAAPKSAEIPQLEALLKSSSETLTNFNKCGGRGTFLLPFFFYFLFDYVISSF